MGPSFDTFGPVLDEPNISPRSHVISPSTVVALNMFAALLLGAMIWFAPPAIALGLAGPVFILLGAAVATYAWLSHEGSSAGRLSAWDVAGIYVFLGCIAVGLANPDVIAHLF